VPTQPDRAASSLAGTIFTHFFLGTDWVKIAFLYRFQVKPEIGKE
jgi:hypothetical protein